MTIKEFEDALNCYIENAKQLGNNDSFIDGAKRMAKYAVSLANELNKIAWHRIYDYPLYPPGSEEYVLVSKTRAGTRDFNGFFIAKMDVNGFWRGVEGVWHCSDTDRWCYIDLPED